MSSAVMSPQEAFLPHTHLLALDMPVVRALVFSPSLEEILVCQRKTGEWELPGGKCVGRALKEEGIREVLEETEISILARSAPVLHEEREFESEGIQRRYLGLIMLGCMIQGPGQPKPKFGEVKNAEWLTLYNAPQTIVRRDMKFRMGMVTALEALQPNVQNIMGTLPRQSLERIIKVISGREVSFRDKSYADEQVA